MAIQGFCQFLRPCWGQPLPHLLLSNQHHCARLASPFFPPHSDGWEGEQFNHIKQSGSTLHCICYFRYSELVIRQFHLWCSIFSSNWYWLRVSDYCRELVHDHLYSSFHLFTFPSCTSPAFYTASFSSSPTVFPAEHNLTCSNHFINTPNHTMKQMPTRSLSS